MLLKKLFPYALAACFAFGMFPSVAAQTDETRPRDAVAMQAGESRSSDAAHSTKSLNLSRLDADPVIISLASEEDINRAKPETTKRGTTQFRQLMRAAIEEHLGARYSYGATGPSAFDCSGFVWSTFQSAGIDFERASAQTLWSRFSAPTPDDAFKFGTLVFFSNLTHVGIVADENGFYHVSRHRGVVYSPFSQYWLSRIDGFRKVPMAEPIN